jgi:cyanophycinase-like exopeptidase
MSSVMIAGGNQQVRIGTGFSLLPGVVIDQHFENRKRQQRLLGVLAQHRNCLGLGIDEQTAVVLRGHSFMVVGNETISRDRASARGNSAAILKRCVCNNTRRTETNSFLGTCVQPFSSKQTE